MLKKYLLTKKLFRYKNEKMTEVGFWKEATKISHILSLQHDYLVDWRHITWHIGVWGLASSLMVHLCAVITSLCGLYKHKYARFYSILLVINGLLVPLTIGLLTSRMRNFLNGFMKNLFSSRHWWRILNCRVEDGALDGVAVGRGTGSRSSISSYCHSIFRPFVCWLCRCAAYCARCNFGGTVKITLLTKTKNRLKIFIWISLQINFNHSTVKWGVLNVLFD